MLRYAPILLLMLAALAGPAFAASQDGASRKASPPKIPAPAEAETDGLRGALGAELLAIKTRGLSSGQSLVQAQIGVAPASSGLPAPGRALARLSLGPTPGANALRSLGDPAPICRATCAKTRLVCRSGESEDCDSTWAQCVADCSVPANP